MTEEPGGLLSLLLQRMRHDLVNEHAHRHTSMCICCLNTNAWHPKFSLEGVSPFPEEPMVLSIMMALAEQHLLIVY